MSTFVEAAILQSGETFMLRPLRDDGTTALGAVSATTDGGFLTNQTRGTTIPLTDWIRSVGMSVIVCPLNPALIFLNVDDNDPAWIPSGTWTQRIGGTPGNPFNGNGASNNQYHTSTTGTCAYPFTGMIPGRYRLSAHLWDLVGPDRTNNAVYTVRDGSGNVLAVFNFDLTRTLWPTFDRIGFGIDLHDLGYFTLGPGQTSISVTLSNPSGVGLLVADTLTVTSAFLPLAVPGDTVTATLPAGLATVAGIPTDAITMPVIFHTDRTWCHPIHAPADRVMKAGVNVGGIRQGQFPVYTADRGIGNDAWTGNITLDQHYEMMSNTNVARRTMGYYPCGDGLSQRGMYLMDNGVVRTQFRPTGVNFDAAAQAATGLTQFDSGLAPMPTGTTFGPKTFTDRGGGLWWMEQAVNRPIWAPHSARSSVFSPYWCQGFQFVTTQPGLVIKEWEWFDPRVPNTWDKVAHPDEVTRFGGTPLVIRSMDWLSTNFSKARNIGDFTTTADRVVVNGSVTSRSGNPEYITWQGNLLSVRPADLDPNTDSDDVYKHQQLSQFACDYVATFDAPVTGYPDGINPELRDIGTGIFPATLGGLHCGIGGTGGAYQIPGKPNELLVLSGFTDGILATGERATIDTTYTFTGAIAFTRKNNLLPYESFIRYCVDVGGEPWVNIPHAASDELIDWMADTAIALTDPDQVFHLEYSNEIWNPSWGQFQYFYSMREYANYLHTVDPTNNPFYYDVPNYWLAHKCGDIFKRWRARWVAAGRDPNKVTRHMCVLTQNYDVTIQFMTQCAVEGPTYIDFDYLGLDGYQDKDPPGFALDFQTSESATGARLSPDGMLDVLTCSTFHGIRHLWSEGHLIRMAQVGGTFYSNKLLSIYEGGWSYIAIDRNGPRGRFNTWEMMANPRMFYITASKQSFYQDISYRVMNKYVMSYFSIPGNNVAWSDFYANIQLPGHGLPTENVNPYDWPNTVCQTFGGRVAWAAGFDFSEGVVPPGSGGAFRFVTSGGQLRLMVG
jgi:hypothetical protein